MLASGPARGPGMRMCMVAPEGALPLPSSLRTPYLSILLPSSIGRTTPFGPHAQDGVAAALRKDVCAHLGHVHFCERGEWVTERSWSGLQGKRGAASSVSYYCWGTLGTHFLFNFRFTYISRLILPTSCIHPSIHLSISAIYLHSQPLTVPPVFPSIHPITCHLSSMQLLIHPFRHPPIVLPSFIQLSFCLSIDPCIHPTDESAGIF